jgi:hypothetical protein
MTRTLDQLRREQSTSCFIPATKVSKLEAVNLLQQGGATRGSDTTADGRGVQWYEFEGRLYHWVGGRWPEDRIDDFPDPTMVSQSLRDEMEKIRVKAVEQDGLSFAPVG